MDVLKLIPRQTYNTCNFPGEGVRISILTPPPHLYGVIIQKSRESVETIDTPQIYGCSIRVASLIVLMFCSGQNSSITKGNNFSIMQTRVMVLVHCISPHLDLSTIDVSS